MILFFGNPKLKLFAVEISERLSIESIKKLSWVLDSSIIESKEIKEKFVGPKSSMITPWSTNAVEITRNMGVKNINRIEVFVSSKISEEFDRMIHEEYKSLDQNIFENNLEPEKVKFIDDLKKYNNEHGLALDDFEISYLENLSIKIGRKLTDSEVYGFSQVNSEHCRHKIFNGQFIIDGKEKSNSLFELIKSTSKKNKNSIVSALF
jgi:phosphoribosylformylglycinamidine synthase